MTEAIDDRTVVNETVCCISCRHLKANLKTAFDECKRNGEQPSFYYDLAVEAKDDQRLKLKCGQWRGR